MYVLSFRTRERKTIMQTPHGRARRPAAIKRMNLLFGGGDGGT